LIPIELIKFLSEKLQLKEELDHMHNLGVVDTSTLNDDLDCNEPLSNIDIDVHPSNNYLQYQRRLDQYTQDSQGGVFS
jgi:hypothetical protein